MNRYCVLACLITVLAATTVVTADTAYIPMYPGYNWVSAPLVPFNFDPASVFAARIGNCTLTRFDAWTEAIVTYPSGGFGNILLGDGHKV